MRPESDISHGEGIETVGPPKEIEVKIVNLGDPQVFLDKVKALGGVLAKERRLLSDTGYKINKEVGSQKKSLDIILQNFGDAKQMEQMLQFLGLTITARTDKFVNAFKPEVLPKRTVRLRQDGEKTVWTIKEPRTKGAKVDERQELEMAVSDPQATKQLLGDAGYIVTSERQKYRTTFQLGKALVELNEVPKVPPWAEIEASTQDGVLEAVRLLGYSQNDTAAISDKDYYRRHGLTDEEVEFLKFNSKD